MSGGFIFKLGLILKNPKKLFEQLRVEDPAKAVDFSFWLTLLSMAIWIPLSLIASGFRPSAVVFFAAFFTAVTISIFLFLWTFFWAFLLHLYVKRHVKAGAENTSYWRSYQVYAFGSLLPENLTYGFADLLGRTMYSGILPQIIWISGLVWAVLNLIIGGTILFETTRKKMMLAALLYLATKVLFFKGHVSIKM
ncbi:MAG: hypothetical protein MCM46_17265 [Candidatus Manganitrophus sp. SB1]|nr:hypothetical protein [Candidatus Manganitrophus morganii]